jgi:hypothetical protein
VNTKELAVKGKTQDGEMEPTCTGPAFFIFQAMPYCVKWAEECESLFTAGASRSMPCAPITVHIYQKDGKVVPLGKPEDPFLSALDIS